MFTKDISNFRSSRPEAQHPKQLWHKTLINPMTSMSTWWLRKFSKKNTLISKDSKFWKNEKVSCKTISKMLIKEYRIPLPMTVEEYRIAQLYMIAKKSRQESKVCWHYSAWSSINLGNFIPQMGNNFFHLFWLHCHLLTGYRVRGRDIGKRAICRWTWWKRRSIHT